MVIVIDVFMVLLLLNCLDNGFVVNNVGCWGDSVVVDVVDYLLCVDGYGFGCFWYDFDDGLGDIYCYC